MAVIPIVEIELDAVFLTKIILASIGGLVAIHASWPINITGVLVVYWAGVLEYKS